MYFSFLFTGWFSFKLVLFLLVLFFLLAEASNGHQPRCVYKCSYRDLSSWFNCEQCCILWKLCIYCNKTEFAVPSHYGIWLCRLNGKSMRVKKNHSSSNLMHNHKLFNGDMLSFIQVATIMITQSHHFFFQYFFLMVRSVCFSFSSTSVGSDVLDLLFAKLYLTKFLSFRHQDNRFQLLCKVAFALSTSMVSIQD